MRITRKRTVDNDEISVDKKNMAVDSVKSGLDLKNLEQVHKNFSQLWYLPNYVIILKLEKSHFKGNWKLAFQVNDADLVSTILKQGQEPKESQSLFDSDNEEDTTLKVVEVPVGVDNDASENFLNKNKAEVTTPIDENAVQLVVDKVTKKIASTIETLVVTDRVSIAEQNMADWRNLCNILTANPELINNKIMANSHPKDALKVVGPDFENLAKVWVLHKVYNS